MSIGAGAIRAGLAAVELYVDQSKLEAGLNQAATALKGFASKVTRIGAGMGGVGAPILAPILAALKGAMSQATAMDSLALRLGTTTDRASALAYALGTVGLSEQDLVGFNNQLNSAFSAAADGSYEAVEAFTRLGLNWRELANSSPEKRVLAVVEALGRVREEYDRSKYTNQLLGAGGMAAVRAGAPELRKRMREGVDLGAVVSPERAAQAKEIERSFAQMGSAIKLAFLEVGRAILPQAETIREFATIVVSISKAVGGWLSENKTLVLTILGIGAALTGAGAGLVALGLGIPALIVAVKALALGLAIVAGAVLGMAVAIPATFAVLLPPLLVVGAVVANLVMVWKTFGGVAVAAWNAVSAALKKWWALFAPLRNFVLDTLSTITAPILAIFNRIGSEAAKTWATLTATAGEAWEGIWSALKRGDLSSAWDILVAGAKVAWAQIKASFLSVWYTIRDAILSAWDSVMAGPTKKGREAARIMRRERDRSSDLERGLNDRDVQKERENLRKLVEQEREKASEGKLATGSWLGWLGKDNKGPLRQAAREVRGTFGQGLTGSAGFQQALGIGSTPGIRSLVDGQKEANGYLAIIADKTEGAAAWR